MARIEDIPTHRIGFCADGAAVCSPSEVVSFQVANLNPSVAAVNASYPRHMAAAAGGPTRAQNLMCLVVLGAAVGAVSCALWSHAATSGTPAAVVVGVEPAGP